MACILVVEDDRGIRDLLNELLVFEGHHTVLADNGQAALALAVSEQPDLVLMDLMLPVLDGVAAIRMLKADPQTADIPIIAMSAKTGLLREAQGCAVDHALTKPFDLLALLNLVEDYSAACKSRCL